MTSDRSAKSATIDLEILERDEQVLLIAEVAQAHDGSLDLAHAYVDAVADALVGDELAGVVGAIKFQTHLAAEESTPREPWRTRFSRVDETRYEYWRRMELPEPAWHGLAAHARERGLRFLSSPFSPAAVRLLDRVGVACWKIASGEVWNGPLLDALADAPRPVILSTGMSGWDEIDAAVEALRARALPLAVLQCTSMYPTPPDQVGLGVLAELKERYGVPVGLSDHSGGIAAGLGAVALGGSIVEVHVAMSRHTFSPDLPVSLTIEELRRLATGAADLRLMRRTVDKDVIARTLAPMRSIFGKSVVAARDLEAGRVLEPADLALKKPGDGLPPQRLEGLYGRTLRRAVARDDALADDDLEDGSS